MLQTINLTKRFGGRVLFENVNLKLDVGKRYGLIGANGAGKSTFLRIVAGLEEPTSGEIVIGSGLRVGVLGQNQFAFEALALKRRMKFSSCSFSLSFLTLSNSFCFCKRFEAIYQSS